MKLPSFPLSKFYEFKINSSDKKVWDTLKSNTYYSHSLNRVFTNKKFIGIVGEKHFRIISSSDSYYVYESKFNRETNEVILKLRINDFLDSLIRIFRIVPPVLIILMWVSNGFTDSYIFLLLLIFQLLFTKIFSIGKGFKITSKKGFKDLQKILGITQFKEVEKERWNLWEKEFTKDIVCNVLAKERSKQLIENVLNEFIPNYEKLNLDYADTPNEEANNFNSEDEMIQFFVTNKEKKQVFYWNSYYDNPDKIMVGANFTGDNHLIISLTFDGTEETEKKYFKKLKSFLNSEIGVISYLNPAEYISGEDFINKYG